MDLWRMKVGKEPAGITSAFQAQLQKKKLTYEIH
jgi:hypothetical protein